MCVERIDGIAAAVGIAAIPATWRNKWDEYLAWLQESKCASQDWTVPANAAHTFGLPDGALPQLNEVCTRIAADSQLADLAGLWHFIIFHATAGITEYPNGWPAPTVLGELAPLFPLAVLVSGTEHALQAFNKMHIPTDITLATLAFGGMYVNDYYRRHGMWGLGELGWLMNHVHANIFRLGRLVFKAATYQWPFRVYQNRLTGQLVTLCENKGAYRADGLANGTNGVTVDQVWTPTFEIEADYVKGCPVSDTGIALQQPLTLLTVDWVPALKPGDRIIEVHIPYGGKLLLSDCVEAYRQAIDFFTRYYPNDTFTAFTCRSWLMDPGLAQILPPTANIVQFQQPFHRLPVVGTEHQAYSIVFGTTTLDPQTAPHSTFLQQAIIQHVSAGHKMRSSAGYITMDEMLTTITKA